MGIKRNDEIIGLTPRTDAGEPVNKHDEREAERLLIKGLRLLKLDDADLTSLKKGDCRKKVIAWTIRKKTSVRNDWISQRLHMGRASNLSRYVKDVDDAQEGVLWELREMMK